MLSDYDDLQRVSDQHEINHEDVLLIAINACGIANQRDSRRSRFEFAPHGRDDDPVYLIPSFDRKASPFRVDEDQLWLRDRPVGTVRRLKEDDVVMGYFRNGHYNLTLNSNARSACTGCVFCYTRLDPASDPQISEAEELNAYFAFLKSDKNWSDLSEVKKISVCSGCFYHEELALRHMELVSKVAAQHGFVGQLHILSSVIRTAQGIQRIAEHLLPFHLTLTVECLQNRTELLKRTKADLEPESMIRLLADAKAAGMDTDFTYLVGLDALEPVIEQLAQLIEATTMFPRFQVYQAHNALQSSYRAYGSQHIDFYLKFRKALEKIFKGSALRPKSWENYRPLWYYTFDGEPAKSARI